MWIIAIIATGAGLSVGSAIFAISSALADDPPAAPVAIVAPTETPTPDLSTGTPVPATAFPANTPILISANIPALNLSPAYAHDVRMFSLDDIFAETNLPEGFAYEVTLPYKDCLNDIGISIDEVHSLAHPHLPGGTLTIVSGQFLHANVTDRLAALGFTNIQYQGSELWTAAQACIDVPRYEHRVDAVAILNDGEHNYIVIGDESPVKSTFEASIQGSGALPQSHSSGIVRALEKAGQGVRAWAGDDCSSGCLGFAVVSSASDDNNALDIKYVQVYDSEASAAAGWSAMESWFDDTYIVLKIDVQQDKEFMIIDATVAYVPSELPPTPTHTPVSTSTPLPPTNTPVPPTNTPIPPTNTPEPTNTSTATATSSPIATHTPLPTSTPTPIPTATHTASPTPIPTHTPVPCVHFGPGADLNRCDLSGRDFRGFDLTGANLSYANLEGTNFKDAILTNATIAGASLEGIDLTNVDLSTTDISGIQSFNKATLLKAVFPPNTDLAEATFVDTDLSRSSLVGANLEKADFTRAVLYSANLNQAVLIDANFRRANLKGVFLNGANLQRANLAAADFSEIYFDVNPDFRGADLRNANFHKAVLDGVDFSGARLDEAKFNRAELNGATFVNAKLNEAEMKDAAAQGARFNGADVSDATFSESDLTNASFHGADIEDAKFSEADLTGANFSAALNADKAIFDDTICSDGTTSSNCYFEGRLRGIRP